MNSYIEIQFKSISPEHSDLLVAQLSEIGFDGFEETENQLKAFIKSANFDETAVKEIADNLGCIFTQSTIEETNWNAVWESNFSPVIVDDFVGIRAHFHEPIAGVKYEIVITPKMSFGTGHHATTHLMMQQMREIDFAGKTVFDFGTGTGVLAILAEKLGAAKILAVDNDDWSIENAAENITRNDCNKIQLLKADKAATQGRYNIILANINKNVILDNMKSLAALLNKEGILLMSGLLKDDEADINEAAINSHLLFEKIIVRNGWICMKFLS